MAYTEEKWLAAEEGERARTLKSDSVRGELECAAGHATAEQAVKDLERPLAEGATDRPYGHNPGSPWWGCPGEDSWVGSTWLADTPKVFQSLDKWIPPRLRALQLKQWKRGRMVYRELRARGASEQIAKIVAANARRWWKNSALYLHTVLPNRYFDGLGLPRLAT
jgi:hypothetical protein